MKISRRVRTSVASGTAVVALVAGIAVPAFASSRDVQVNNRKDGWASASWTDNAGSTPTRVTFSWCAPYEFRSRIRKERAGVIPDSTVGSEWINCESYPDAVYSDGDTSTGKYHFDINGMDSHYGCDTGFCDYRTYADATVYW